MKIILLYYTGTNNTAYLSHELKKKWEGEHDVTLYKVYDETFKKVDLSTYDIVGIGYPIYAFNVPSYFLKFLKKQDFPRDKKYFIYKNSGETLHLNDASSLSIIKLLKKQGICVNNEYHFPMPYNIIFRFKDDLIKEMLTKNDKLLDILSYEVMNNVSHISKYKMGHKIVTQLLKIQYIAGPINSWLYHVNKKKCSLCGLCIKNCPVHNIYLKNGKIRFHHHCLMCMRCSLYCPKDAFFIGFLEPWKVNKPYDFKMINNMVINEPVITNKTKGFFKCYYATFQYIDKRYEEIAKSL